MNPENEAAFHEWQRQQEADSEPAQGESAQLPTSLDADTVQRMIDQALQRQAAQHQAEMDAIRGQLASAVARLPVTLIPEHGAGAGTDTIATTWSQYDQELARAGKHPHQSDESADWLEYPSDVEETRVGTTGLLRTRRSTKPAAEAA